MLYVIMFNSKYGHLIPLNILFHFYLFVVFLLFNLMCMHLNEISVPMEQFMCIMMVRLSLESWDFNELIAAPYLLDGVSIVWC